MSYDLTVATSTQPCASNLDSFLAGREDLSVEGKLELGAGNVLVSSLCRGESSPLFTVDGPFRVEVEDLAEELAGAVLVPQWLVEISVPACGGTKGVSVAKALARHVAKSCQGAVYDPQEDAVIWPKGRRKRYIAVAAEQRTRVIELAWCLPVSMSSAETARVLLAVVRTRCPEALPYRFGTFEPLQGRLEPGDDEPFLRIWSEESSIPYGGSFFWKSRPPCLGGQVFFADPRDGRKPAGASRAIKISASFDGRAVDNDARWCEAVVSLFVDLANMLNAFYGAAYVQRNVIVKRNAAWYDGESETYSPLPRSPWWLGIPRDPTWLGWFGGPYKSEAETAAKSIEKRSCKEGVLLRAGARPMDREQLKSIRFGLPRRILVRYKILGAEPVPAKSIPELV